MEIKVQSLTTEGYDQRDGDIMHIFIDGERVFRVMDGESEDATLGRDFNDCWGIPDLLEQAHKAGVNGEPFTVVRERVSLEDI